MVNAVVSPAMSPALAAQPIQRRSTVILLASVLSGGLLWASYFPLNFGFLAWFALVPFLTLVRAEILERRRYFYAALGALAFYVPALQWMSVADVRMILTWIGLTVYCTGFMLLSLALIRYLDLRACWPLAVSVPVVWVALEYVRSFALTGFAWYYLGHSQHDYLPIIQIADLGGAYAVSFLVAAVNGVILSCLLGHEGFRKLFLQAELPPRGVAWQLSAVGFLAVFTAIYGAWRLGDADFADGPRLALLQGNVDQRIRNAASAPGPDAEKFRESSAEHYAKLHQKAASLNPKPDLIVWPETSFSDNWYAVAPHVPLDRVPGYFRRLADEWSEMALRAGRASGRSELLGLSSYIYEADGRETRYNSALLIRPGGRLPVRYDKMHCVPFGEYVPLRNWLPFLAALAPYSFEYSVQPGDQFTRFPLVAQGQTYHFGVIICYEGTNPVLARSYVRLASGQEVARSGESGGPGYGGPVDFLVNISNDGWFDGSAEHEQHLAICRFRAVECRRALARAVNMGISAVVDGNGRVIALPGRTWADSKKFADVLSAVIPIDNRHSIYAVLGDWLPCLCWFAILSGGITGFARRQRSF